MRLYLLLLLTFFAFSRLSAQENRLEIPDSGWRLWPDTAAAWQYDSLYLPDEVQINLLPVNPPTGGWERLSSETGIAVNLPSTVEEHYWGEFGFRPYHNAYYFEREDEQVKNGNYLGVSWWWRNIDVPQDFAGKKVLLHVRGARQRAEVYLNQKLVGYHLIGETAFECDVSAAIRPGETNLLAIRITNPGGRLDWADTHLMKWGNYEFHASHGFGGLDRALFLTAHDPVYLEDAWVLNTPNPVTIRSTALLANDYAEPVNGRLLLQVLPQNGSGPTLAEKEFPFQMEANGFLQIEEEMSVPEAQLWNPDHPQLYRLRFSVQAGNRKLNKIWQDEKYVTFGFRWFEADGIGKEAVLRLNGQRIRLISAISWGFWGYNGLWPRPDLAEKEVRAAKAFGMNTIQFHRNIGKAEVLDAQDHLGLLRFMEPGGGQTAFGTGFSMYAPSPQEKIDISGIGARPQTFAEKYMEEKIIRMIRDHRSHPSLLMYNIQNEIHPDLRNPRIFHVLHRMHEEDPSRIITLKSGIPPRNQVWYQPYDDSLYYDHGDGYSGWWDQHTVGGPGVWQDQMYQNPQDFTHRSVNDSEIVAWGEMLGAAVPDRHQQMIRTIQENGGNSYDLKDHQEIVAAYEKFLDKWNFRQAFPQPDSLFADIAGKSYDFWGRVIESARLAEANDYLVISGWESTAIENHSGLLDNLRQFKGTPQLLKERFAALRPVIKPRSLVVATGMRDTLDLFLLNETRQPAGQGLRLTLYGPARDTTELGLYKIPVWKKDRFVYPVGEPVITPRFESAGKYRLHLQLAGKEDAFASETILVVDNAPKEQIPPVAGVVSHEPDFIQALSQLGVRAKPFNPSENYDLLIATTRLLHGWTSVVDSTTEIENTDDDRLFHTESWGYDRNLEYTFADLPKGKATVTLRFAEVTLSSEKARVFDVAVNGKQVL
ncbi:MAG: malectin domain-containing carbohydrate-binding protein, partial [Calditrichia bacterium]